MGTNKRYANSIDARHIPTVPWEPILDAIEIDPGLWSLKSNSYTAAYARVQFVRRAGQLGYRAERPDGELLGYYTSLSSACLHAWEDTIGPTGGLPAANSSVLNDETPRHT